MITEQLRFEDFLKVQVMQYSPKSSPVKTPPERRSVESEENKERMTGQKINLEDIVFAENITKPKCVVLTNHLGSGTQKIFNEMIMKGDFLVRSRSLFD